MPIVQFEIYIQIKRFNEMIIQFFLIKVVKIPTILCPWTKIILKEHFVTIEKSFLKER